MLAAFHWNCELILKSAIIIQTAHIFNRPFVCFRTQYLATSLLPCDVVALKYLAHVFLCPRAAAMHPYLCTAALLSERFGCPTCSGISNRLWFIPIANIILLIIDTPPPPLLHIGLQLLCRRNMQKVRKRKASQMQKSNILLRCILVIGLVDYANSGRRRSLDRPAIFKGGLRWSAYLLSTVA